MSIFFIKIRQVPPVRSNTDCDGFRFVHSEASAAEFAANRRSCPRLQSYALKPPLLFKPLYPPANVKSSSADVLRLFFSGYDEPEELAAARPVARARSKSPEY